MLRKRLIGVVTVKDGWAVQSFAYNRYLPLGKPECLVENLDRWGADEILVLGIDRTRLSRGPDFELLRRLSRLGLSTPLIYGGGIATVEDGIKAIQVGADRICLDALLRCDLRSVRRLSECLGAQALIGALPMSSSTEGLKLLDYTQGTSGELSADLAHAFEAGAISEALVMDWQHEGTPQGFNAALIERCPVRHVPLIAFGGLSEPDQMRRLLALPRVVAVAVGNFLNYREHAIQALKEQLVGVPLRPSAYETTQSMLVHG